MTISLYVNCGLIGLLGLILAVLMQFKSQRDKAKVANLQFTISGFFADEWINFSISLVVIVIGLVLIPTVVGWKPAYIPFVRPAFLPIGYMGTDIILKLFGVVNKRLNAAIDAKTDISDAATGTLGTPTPAIKP